MATSQRDYILRLIEQLRIFLAEIVRLRVAGRPDDALQAIVRAQERLFSEPADRFLARTPEEQFKVLTLSEPADQAREKILLQADLLAEAARVYDEKEQRALADGARHYAVQLLELATTHMRDTDDRVLATRIETLRDLLAAGSTE